ncbi:hypothetical protein [Bradyrhizobium sp. Ghvi]|uniref:hypothetical protein n=1 Tax=Bradyrhizobium sp. Ghvi TaxID=1855319 RepID=UPI000B83FECD|nr:hypothetical protein [Bradyrhizobium sp. Ghvi]
MTSEPSLPTEHLRDGWGDDTVKVIFNSVEFVARELMPLTRATANQRMRLAVNRRFQNKRSC